MRRRELSETEGQLLEPHTLGQLGTRGAAGQDNRLFGTAVCYRTRPCTRSPWRDLPARVGHWNTVARRFGRRVLTGGWQDRFVARQQPDDEWVLVDLTTVKAHKAAAGQKSTAPAQALGRGRFGTKVHAVVAALGNCPPLTLPPAVWADHPQLPALLPALAQAPRAGMCDKADDTNAVLETISSHPAAPVVAPNALHLDQRLYGQNWSADRNRMARFFGPLKEARGATRYEKTAVSFLAIAHLLAALDWMR